jgi:hypothetical protein
MAGAELPNHGLRSSPTDHEPNIWYVPAYSGLDPVIGIDLGSNSFFSHSELLTSPQELQIHVLVFGML